jgi:hypothetical protein
MPGKPVTGRVALANWVILESPDSEELPRFRESHMGFKTSDRTGIAALDRIHALAPHIGRFALRWGRLDY